LLEKKMLGKGTAKRGKRAPREGQEGSEKRDRGTVMQPIKRGKHRKELKFRRGTARHQGRLSVVFKSRKKKREKKSARGGGGGGGKIRISPCPEQQGERKERKEQGGLAGFELIRRLHKKSRLNGENLEARREKQKQNTKKFDRCWGGKREMEREEAGKSWHYLNLAPTYQTRGRSEIEKRRTGGVLLTRARAPIRGFSSSHETISKRVWRTRERGKKRQRREKGVPNPMNRKKVK